MIPADELADVRAALEEWMTDRATIQRPRQSSTNPLAPGGGSASTIATEVPASVSRLPGRLVADLERRGISAAWLVKLPASTADVRVGDRLLIYRAATLRYSLMVVDVLVGSTLDLSLGLACVTRS
jgi:hypothetical protein